MPNKKVSELDAITNLQDDDLIEVTKYMGTGLGDGGGDYTSYKMTWANFRTAFGLFKITKQTFNISSVMYSYTPARYEAVEKVVLKGIGDLETLRILDYNNNEIYPQTEGNRHDVGIYNESSVTAEREIKIYPSASCTIVIISNIGI